MRVPTLCRNHVLEVEEVLGVEAARTQISAEIQNIMNVYGIGIDGRHLLLLSDVMTFKGEVLGLYSKGACRVSRKVVPTAPPRPALLKLITYCAVLLVG